MNSTPPGSPISLSPARCAICGTEGNATEVYAANFASEAFNPDVFSARRLPDTIHYRLFKCRACGLVRSDPIASPVLLAQLYAQSTSTLRDEVAALRLTSVLALSSLHHYCDV